MFNICDLPKSFFEAATKKTFELTKENPNIEENLSLIDKVSSVIPLLVQPDGETYCCYLNLLAHIIEITAIYVYICNNVFLVHLKFIF